MCYPEAYRLSLYESETTSRELILPVARAEVAEEVVSLQVPVELGGMAARGGGRGAEMKKCVCSPTRHPGSFRCRNHHSQYEWVGRSYLGSKLMM